MADFLPSSTVSDIRLNFIVLPLDGALTASAPLV
jgi:hypothetical protein